ncbi:MAG: WD40/YVTN/BNR-like repeat-containing protein, partial [Actinomycetota bacterium]
EDPIWAVAMATPSRIVLGSQGGKILLSTNQGRSFREVEFLRNEAGEATNTNVGWPIDGLVFGTKKVGYAGTNGRGTWRTEDGGRTWFREPSAQSAAGLNIGDVAAAGPHRALAGGAHAVARRVTQ